MGVGLGLVFAPAFNLATSGVANEDSGVASATVNVVQQVGGSIGTALLNTIASTAAATYLGSHVTAAIAGDKTQFALLQAQGAVHSYTVAFWWAVGIFALAAVVTVGLLRSGVPAQSESNSPAAHAL